MPATKPSKDFTEMVGRRMATARAFKGMTQAQLGKKLGKGYQYISHWECGMACPTAQNLAEICRALECSSDFLLGLTTDIQGEYHG